MQQKSETYTGHTGGLNGTKPNQILEVLDPIYNTKHRFGGFEDQVFCEGPLCHASLQL
jgi:hypothetical protein